MRPTTARRRLLLLRRAVRWAYSVEPHAAGEGTMAHLRVAFFFLVLVAAGAGTGTAYAALGGDAGSVASDREVLHATDLGRTDLAAWSLYQMNVGGTLVKQYLSGSGVVFAVTWKGLAHPDLRRLLGTYWPEYQRSHSASLKKPGQRSRRLASAQLVVEQSGHMRALSGRAYVPSLLPEGLSLDDLQ